MKTLVRSLLAVLPVLTILLTYNPPAAAQFRAGIQGSVVDPNGGLVPEATVTLTSQETAIVRKVTTSGDGVFTISGLAPGKYQLTVEKTGFSKKILSDVEIGAEQMQSVQVQLAVGTTSESITVDAAVEQLLEKETAMVGGTLTAREIEVMPSFGRDPYQLMRLTPGIFGDGALSGGGGTASLPGSNIGGSSSTSSIFQVENGVQIEANGTRQNSNNFQVDGLSVNSTSWGGAAVVTPSEESIKEVRVVSNNYSAENGRTSGAQVMVVSQNGTNEIHGSAFFKFHRPGLNAFQKWNGPGTPSPVQKDENRFNQFGGGIGGPIRKNKLFAFFAYETLRNNSVNVATGWYETSQYLQTAGPQGSIARKLLSYPGEGPSYTSAITFTCAQAGLPSTQCHDASGGLDIGSPLKTALGAADPTYGQTGTPYGIGSGFDGSPDVQFLQTVSPNIQTNVQYNGRLDYQATSKDLAAFSIYWTPVSTQSYNGPARAANKWNHSSVAKTYTALYTHTFSPTVINEARFGAAGWSWNEIDSNPQEPWGLPPANIDGMGSVGVQGYGAPGPSVFDQLSYNYKDTLSKVHNSHSLKFGADITHATFVDEAPWSARPSYNFRNLWSFANDAPYTEGGNFNPLTGQPTAATKNLRFNTIAVFAQDDWRVRPNLTVNLGLRWEDFTPLTEASGNISNVILGSGSSILTGLSIKKGGGLYDNTKTNFGPQVGFAWSPKSNSVNGFGNRFVLRGGFGVGYNLEQLAITSNGRFNPPFLTSLNLYGSQILYGVPSSVTSFNNYPSNPAAVQSFNSAGLPTSGAAVSLTGFPQNFPPAVTYHYSLDAQVDLSHNIVATLGYQGSQTRHYTEQTNINYLNWGALNPAVQSVDWYYNGANAHYNALLAEVRHRFASEFELDLQYRLAKSVDMGSQDYYQDNYLFDLSHSHGPSDFDATNSFKLWGSWTPKFSKGGHSMLDKVAGGWTLSGILTGHSGFPWTPQYCNTGGNVAYPNSGYGCLYPASFTGSANDGTSNATFMTPNGNFPKGALAYLTVPTFPKLGPPQAPAANVTRNMFRGPGYFGDDFQIAKAFGLPHLPVLGENAKLNLQANFYNMFNKLNLTNMNTTISNDGVTSNPQFGTAQGAFNGRIVELQMRFSF